MSFIALNDRIIVTTTQGEKKTNGGIIIPETAQKKSCVGTVVSVGSKCELVAVGDKIVYGEYSGTEVILDDQEYLIMGEEDALCKIL